MSMPVPYSPRSFPWALLIAVLGIPLLAGGCQPREDAAAGPIAPKSIEHAAPVIHDVYPGDDIQKVLDGAALALNDDLSGKVTVRLRAGTYRPPRHGQALIHFNRRHDGITLEGVGNVVLTAANDKVADRSDASFPAVVNHVVFFGDGVSSRTILRGVTITGANGFAGDDDALPSIEPDSDIPQLAKSLFYYVDGGAIKIFGRSYPTIDSVIVADNYTKLCGAGVSVEHRGFFDSAAVFKNCEFRNNRCPGTGSAIDVLGGSAAEIENCLFVGNIANTGMDQIAAEYGLRYNPEHGCGALTVFPDSRVSVRRCTFTANWNGADDKGVGNAYIDSIFWHNTAGDGSRPGEPYELDIIDARNVRGCYFGGGRVDLRATIDATKNNLQARDPEFDAAYRPLVAEYKNIGYRPLARAQP